MSRSSVLLLAPLAWVWLACGPTPGERRGEIYDLQQDPTPENVEKIRERLSDEDRDVRATALFTLVSMGVDDARELALAGVRDDDGFVRATAAKLLGDLRHEEAAPLLVRHLLSDSDAVVRQRCAEALGEIGGEAAQQGLVQALEDPLKNVRLAAVEGVALHAPQLALEGLTRLLREDSEWEIRVQAAHALGRSGLAEARAPLEAALEDRNEFVRAAAAQALRVLG